MGPVSCNDIVYVPGLPEARSGTHFADRAWTTLGGTSAGKALNLARLGADVTLLTVLGTDLVAGRVRRSLEAAGIRVLSLDSRSGTCERHINLMTTAGERVSIYTHLPEPVEPWTLADADRLLADADVVVADLADHARPWVSWAQDAGVPVWTDLHDYDGRSAFHADFARADHLQLSSVALSEWRTFAERSAAERGRTVVVTHGADGSSAVGADEHGRRCRGSRWRSTTPTVPGTPSSPDSSCSASAVGIWTTRCARALPRRRCASVVRTGRRPRGTRVKK